MLRIFRHYIPGLSLGLFAGDLAIVLASFFLVSLPPRAWLGEGPLGPKVALMAAVATFMLHLGDLYNVRLPLGRREVIARLLTCQAVAALITAAVGFALPVAPSRPGRLRRDRAARDGRARGLAHGLARALVARAHADPGAGARRRGHRAGHRRPRADRRPARSDHRLPGRQPERARHGARRAMRSSARSRTWPSSSRRRARTSSWSPRWTGGATFPAKALLDCRLRGIQVEDWPDLLREGDRQDPGHRPAAELADLLRRLREDPAHRDHQARCST